MFNPHVSGVLPLCQFSFTIIDCSSSLLLVSSHLVTNSALLMRYAQSHLFKAWGRSGAMWYLFPADMPTGCSDDLLVQFRAACAYQLSLLVSVHVVWKCVRMGVLGGWANVPTCVFSFVFEEINILNVCFKFASKQNLNEWNYCFAQFIWEKKSPFYIFFCTFENNFLVGFLCLQMICHWLFLWPSISVKW